MGNDAWQKKTLEMLFGRIQMTYTENSCYSPGRTSQLSKTCHFYHYLYWRFVFLTLKHGIDVRWSNITTCCLVQVCTLSGIKEKVEGVFYVERLKR